MTDNETAIVTNQIQGIMNCTEMIRTAYQWKDKSLYKIHKSRLQCLTSMCIKTQEYLIDKYQKTEPLPQITVAETYTTKDQMISNWVAWCNAAIRLYKKETGKWWNYLQTLHTKDLHTAQRFIPLKK